MNVPKEVHFEVLDKLVKNLAEEHVNYYNCRDKGSHVRSSFKAMKEYCITFGINPKVAYCKYNSLVKEVCEK